MDVHFYVDNAPPKEVVPLLSLLSRDVPVTPGDTATLMMSRLGLTMQADKTYSLRRIYDLGLSERTNEGRGYVLNDWGVTVQHILSVAPDLGVDLLHYLHCTPFASISPEGVPTVENFHHARKYMWSYRRCCELMWEASKVLDPKHLASMIQTEMVQVFSWIDFAQFASGERRRAGGRFNATAASAVMTWLRALRPSPISEGRRPALVPREVERFELALLALDDVYRARGYQYGDPVTLDETLLRQTAGVFFLDLACCERLLRLAARLLPRRLGARGTLDGTALTLFAPYTIADVASGIG